jgi:hypothetical protein
MARLHGDIQCREAQTEAFMTGIRRMARSLLIRVFLKAKPQYDSRPSRFVELKE